VDDAPRSCMRKECICDPCSNCRESGNDEKALESKFQYASQRVETLVAYMFSFSAGVKYKGGCTPQTTGPSSRSKLTMVHGIIRNVSRDDWALTYDES
jgi:hypothetical protein